MAQPFGIFDVDDGRQRDCWQALVRPLDGPGVEAELFAGLDQAKQGGANPIRAGELAGLLQAECPAMCRAIITSAAAPQSL